VIEMQQKAVMI